VGKEVKVDLGSGTRGAIMASLPRGIDAMGRLYYQGSSFVFNQGQPPTQLDSAPVLRYDRRTAKLDTLTWIQLPKSDVQTSGSAGNASVRITGPNPFAPQRSWTVAPDGRIAFIYPEPYHVEWLSASKTRSAGPEVRYERLKLTEADKAPVQTPNCGVTISLGDGGGGGGRGAGTVQTTVRAIAGAGGPGAPPRTDYPEYKPAFLPRYGAPIVAPNGDLWVGRSRAPNDPPVYDVFDTRGQLVARTQLPKGTRIAGFGNGTIYLFRMDDDDLVYLQRYRLDAAR
jgi:hypothetical protein